VSGAAELVRVHGPSRPALRLLSVPWAGGRADAYRPWIPWLPRDVEIWGVRYPSDPPPEGVQAIAAGLAAQASRRVAEPFAVFGHSLGAVVAFELVRELRRLAAPMPFLLGLSGRAGPQLPPSRRDARKMSDLELLEEVRSLGGMPEELVALKGAMELLLPRLRRDLELSSAYEYADEPPLEVPIVAFAALSDTLAPPDQVAAWSAQTDASFELHRLPGEHFMVMDAAPVVATFFADAVEARRSALGPARA
jgi:medium-chain acyl-[acyl-carrier-protein] hydrolase